MKWFICENPIVQRNLNVNKNLLLFITRFDWEKNPFPGKLKHERVRTLDIQLQGGFDRRNASRSWLADCDPFKWKTLYQ